MPNADRRGSGKLSNEALADELPALLVERGMTLRQLARKAGISPSHLVRVIRGEKGVSGESADAIASALGLPDGYFPEQRLALVIRSVATDAELRDTLYRRLTRRLG